MTDTARGLRVVSWNVLADTYVRAEWFPHTPAHLLRPGARTGAIVEVLASLDADVLALQEAEPDLVDAARTTLRDHTVLWCPKSAGRLDGCLTAIHHRIELLEETRLVYNDGPIPSGHVAHLVTVRYPHRTVRIANTHIRWEPDTTPPGERIGVRQATELTAELAGTEIAAIAADLNDTPGGPVRTILAQAGYTFPQGPGPTSVLNAGELRALDVVAVRGATGTNHPSNITATATMPDHTCPSDHIPVAVDIR